jgi:hypothetical protein
VCKPWAYADSLSTLSARTARECQDVATTDGIYSVKPTNERISVNCRILAGGVWTQVAYEVSAALGPHCTRAPAR